jgi:hypothetical protein
VDLHIPREIQRKKMTYYRDQIRKRSLKPSAILEKMASKDTLVSFSRKKEKSRNN